VVAAVAVAVAVGNRSRYDFRKLENIFLLVIVAIKLVIWLGIVHRTVVKVFAIIAINLVGKISRQSSK
jgi:hypothetical protein